MFIRITSILLHVGVDIDVNITFAVCELVQRAGSGPMTNPHALRGVCQEDCWAPRFCSQQIETKIHFEKAVYRVQSDIRRFPVRQSTNPLMA